jgi:hypothetical protein
MIVLRSRGAWFAFGALLLAICAAAFLTAGEASAAKNQPLIDVEGSSYTQTSNVTGTQVIQQTNFSMHAKEAQGGTVSGTFSEKLYNVATDGTLTQIASNNVNVDCLSADKTSGTVWFSGVVTAGIDQRLPLEQQTQEQQIVNAGQLILIRRFRDSNADGIVDERSLFVTHAAQPWPNALVSNNDDGTISSPWFISGNATSPATACLDRDSDYITADYRVVFTLPAQNFSSVQFLTPDDRTPVGGLVDGDVIGYPPAASMYSVASATRTLLSPTLVLKIR